MLWTAAIIYARSETRWEGCALLELWRYINLRWTAATSYPCMVMCLCCSEILDMVICMTEVWRNFSPWAYSYLILFVAVIMYYSNSPAPCFPKLAGSERKYRINRAVQAEVLYSTVCGSISERFTAEMLKIKPRFKSEAEGISKDYNWLSKRRLNIQH